MKRITFADKVVAAQVTHTDINQLKAVGNHTKLYDNFNHGFRLGALEWFSNENKAVWDIGGRGCLLPSGLGDYANSAIQSGLQGIKLESTEHVTAVIQVQEVTNIFFRMKLYQNVLSDFGAGNFIELVYESGVGFQSITRRDNLETITPIVQAVPVTGNFFKFGMEILNNEIGFHVNGIYRHIGNTNIMRYNLDYYVEITAGKNVTAVSDAQAKNFFVRSINLQLK